MCVHKRTEWPNDNENHEKMMEDDVPTFDFTDHLHNDASLNAFA